MNRFGSLSEQQLSVRVALWAALITVHSVFLAVGFGVVAATETEPAFSIKIICSVAFLGMICPVAATASALAQLRESMLIQAGGAKPSFFTTLFAKFRPAVWLALELISVLSILAVGIVMLGYLLPH